MVSLIFVIKNEASAIFKADMLHLSSNFLLREMSRKKESINYLEELTLFLIRRKDGQFLIVIASLIYVIKIKQVLFSKLTCCVYQVTFVCMRYPVKRRALFQKYIYAWKMLCSNKYYFLRTFLCHTTRNIMSSR